MFRGKKYESEIYPAVRQKQTRRLLWFWIVGVALCVVILAGSVSFILRASWFRVEEFELDGVIDSEKEELISALSIQMLTTSWRGWLGPHNILFWEFGPTPERLERFPEVRHVGVVSHFFSRKVGITIEKRTPYGVVCEAPETGCFLVDDEGILFAPAPETEGTLILRIDDTNNRIPILGRSFLPDSLWIQNVFLTLRTLKESGFIPLKVTINDLSLRAWSVKVAQGPTFLFSLSFSPENLNSILRSLSVKLDFSKVTTVDLQIPNRIYYQ